jgi:hypothetical protein
MLKGIQAWATVGVLTVGVAMCSMRDANIRKEGAAQVVQSVAKQTEKINAKANAARAAARKPGSADRVREWCRDCDG